MSAALLQSADAHFELVMPAYQAPVPQPTSSMSLLVSSVVKNASTSSDCVNFGRFVGTLPTYLVPGRRST